MMPNGRHLVSAAAFGLAGLLWMTSAAAFFCFSGGNHSRNEAVPAGFYGAPAYYPPPVMPAYSGAVPTTSYGGYPYSPAPYALYPAVPNPVQRR